MPFPGSKLAVIFRVRVARHRKSGRGLREKLLDKSSRNVNMRRMIDCRPGSKAEWAPCENGRMRHCAPAKFLMVEGVLQNIDNVVSVKADRVSALQVTNASTQSHDFH